MKRIAKFFGIATMAALPLAAQQDWQEQVDRAMAASTTVIDKLQTPQMQKQLRDATAAAQKAMDHLVMPQLEQVQEEMQRAIAAEQKTMDQLPMQLDQLKLNQFDMPMDFDPGAFDDLKFKLDGMLAFAPQDATDRAQEVRERAQEARERVREQRDRVRETEDRNIEIYRSGTGEIDEHRYEKALQNFDRVIANKWARADGAYYWKAYALNKLGKRDEALAALAEIPKQFPQSRWIGDAKALKVEIQQASGNPVSPDSQSDEDLKLIAISSLMNAEPERTIPLLEKVLSDPKNNLGLKSRALFVLAQNRSDKAREIVTQYAKSGANPDLQIRAVQYLGTFRSPASQQALADVYAANNDLVIRRAVLRSMATSRDSAHLFAAAKSESNPDLRREAIRSLGSMRAASELSQLYASETVAEVKDTILLSLMSSRDAEKLIDIAKTEKNAELRGDAIRYLGSMHDDKSADALASLYGGETDKDVKAQIVRTLGQQGAGKQLVAIARGEKDLALKKECVEWLGHDAHSQGSDRLSDGADQQMIRSASEMKLAALIVTASIAFAQPHVTNAQMETRAVSGSLVSAFHAIVNQQTAPAWIGYSAPMIAGDRSMCCWNTNNGITCQGCMLEPGMATFPATTTGRRDGTPGRRHGVLRLLPGRSEASAKDSHVFDRLQRGRGRASVHFAHWRKGK